MILESPLNYSGSKSKIIEQLKQHFPKKEEVKMFYDVFCGGLSVSMNVDYDNILSNDIINPLINFYTNLYNSSKQDRIEEEIDRILSFKINKDSKDEYNQVREKFNETYDPYLFFALVSSCTNNMMRFNQKFKFNQTFGKRTINDNTIKKLKLYCNSMKNKNITFTNHHFSNLFEIYFPTKDDFLYIDPPYFGITEAGYNSYWNYESEKYLFDLIDTFNDNGVKFALSGVSIHKGVKNPFMDRIEKYKVINIDHDYEKVPRKKNLGETQEILVINY